MFSLPGWLAWSVIAAVVMGWVATTIASIIVKSVEVPASLNGVFLLVAGLVADDLRRNSERKKAEHDAKLAAQKAQQGQQVEGAEQ